MTHNATTLFDEDWPTSDDSLLLADLAALVELGLVAEAPSPDGPTYTLTELGRELPEFRRG